MTSDTYIENLYNQGIVSGSTFLYCVENNICTVSGLLDLKDNATNEVMSDIEYLKSELCIHVSNEIVNDEKDLRENTDFEILKASNPELYSIYQELKYKYDTRTINCLNIIEHTICNSNQEEFIQYILEIDNDTILKIRNAGRKTTLQIKDLSLKLREYANKNSKETERDAREIECKVNDSISKSKSFPQNTEWSNAILSIISSFIATYSIRSQNAIKSFIASCNDNVYQIYEILISPQFNPCNFRNVGKKSIPEIEDFRNRVISVYLEYSSDECIANLNRVNKVLLFKDLGISDPESITLIENEIGHFPLLTATNQYIDNLPDRERKIVKEYLLISRGAIDRDLDYMATELSLSRERIRQLAKKAIQDIENTVGAWKELLADYHYPIFEKNAWLTICEKENVTFTQNFVKWVISLVYEDVHLIGEPISAFKTYHGRVKPLYLIPKHLYDVFYIDNFIEQLKAIVSKKRYEEESLCLREFVYIFFRERVLFEIADEIEALLIKIVENEIDCLLYDGNLIFKANAEKTAPEIIEDIIRANGDVMTLEEIYKAYMQLYPHKQVKLNNIRGNIGQNKNIRPLGRSSKYTLAEWKDGFSRGGTIRDFAYEFIIENPNKIVRLDDLCEYIRQFRDGVENDSVQTNLLAESSGKYGLYIRNGVRYIGLTSIQYDDSYVDFQSNENLERRSTKQSFTLLENFIVEHKRFPFSSGSDDESRLYRFWYNQTKYNNHGYLDDEHRQIYEYLNTKYDAYKVSRSDYIWYKIYIELKSMVENKSFGRLKQSHNSWMMNNVELYKNKQLAEWQQSLFKELLFLIENIACDA